jgi:hypothetical protein
MPASSSAAARGWWGSTTAPGWWRSARRGSAKASSGCMTWAIRSAGCPMAASIWSCVRRRSNTSMIG